MSGRLLSGVYFFPRGGSAHFNRAVCTELAGLGWEVTVVSGSRADLGPQADAARFYAPLEVRPVDFTAALGSTDSVRFDPADGAAPMHGSFEDRPGAPDVVLASLEDAAYEKHVEAWTAALGDAGAAEADALYLHHLSPLNEAARRAAPEVPVVGQVHGTELLMLEAIEVGEAGWEHGESWAERMRAWAARCRRIFVSPAGHERARNLLDVAPESLLAMPLGFDPEKFAPRQGDRREHWRRHLVDEPRGWRPGGEPGTVAYREEELESLASGVVLLYVGRFTEVKRLPLLLEAFTEARPRFETPAALVLLGGYPGEWEGEHPLEVIERLRAEGVFLAGWHGHDELPAFFSASDAVVLPSVREQFGLVLVEGMACGLPPIAVDAYGPAMIIDHGETGWLVAPDDVAGLAQALIEVVNDSAERQRRGSGAREAAIERYSWPGIARRMDAVLREVAAL